MARAEATDLNDFNPARKEKSGVAIAIAGSSGSGKTKTALEVAVGLAGPEGRIAVIDTEGKRALHYARQYKFDHCHFLPPYTPERCTAQIAKAQNGPYDVVIFDSASDEHEGEGGLIEMADAEGAWTKTKQRHKYSLIRRIRSYPGFVIFCLRAEEKVKYEKVNGKTVITPQGWMPICEKRFMYDMTVSFTLSPETPGQIRFDLPRKIGDDFKPLFKEGEFITRRVGEGLRAWALDGDLPAPDPFKWTNLAGRLFTFATATEWRDRVIKTLKGFDDDADFTAWMKANQAHVAEHMAEHPDEAAAIFQVFADRGVYPAGNATASEQSGLPL